MDWRREHHCFPLCWLFSFQTCGLLLSTQLLSYLKFSVFCTLPFTPVVQLRYVLLTSKTILPSVSGQSLFHELLISIFRYSSSFSLTWYAWKLPGSFGKMQIGIQQVWSGVWDSAFLTSLLPMLLDLGTCFVPKDQWVRLWRQVKLLEHGCEPYESWSRRSVSYISNPAHPNWTRVLPSLLFALSSLSQWVTAVHCVSEKKLYDHLDVFCFLHPLKLTLSLLGRNFSTLSFHFSFYPYR